MCSGLEQAGMRSLLAVLSGAARSCLRLRSREARGMTPEAKSWEGKGRDPGDQAASGGEVRLQGCRSISPAPAMREATGSGTSLAPFPRRSPAADAKPHADPF